MTEVRIIKKYPNRRLYDTEISRYITLEEIRQLVLQGIRFRVEDKSSQQDITRSILLQVIAEQEEGGNPMFTTELLQFIIRYYGDPMQTSISRYLELSARLFQEQQLQFTDQLKQMLGQASQPLQVLKEMADKQVPLWRTVRKEFLKNIQAKAKIIKRRAGLDEVTEPPQP
ncbi:MAG TPA: polyhydroxyalkanoate synthesis repressor PhaR [Solimonas sp.]|nr:polyhydroxyalkanoate synthesis repressor PhaR [Solimonas sp.]